MEEDRSIAAPSPPAPLGRSAQQADVLVRLGKRAAIAARVQVDGAGILAIAALVSSIILSTAVLVRAARRK